MVVSSPQYRRKGMKITLLVPILVLSTLALFSLFHTRIRHVPLVNEHRVTNLPPRAPKRPGTQANLDEQQHISGKVSFIHQETTPAESNTSDDITSEKYPQHKQCVMYDRPTRTGSTTISHKLKNCLQEKGYHNPKAYPKDGKAGLRMVPHMLRQNATRVVLSSVHVRILQADVDDVLAKCDHILYITSCAPMRDRMWSAAKFLVGDSSKPRNRNTTVAMDKEEALRRMKAQERYEDAREAYPFVDVDNKPLEMRRKLIPDYVIRKERMEEDFVPLLEALGCTLEIESHNVHAEEDESIKSLVRNVPLKHNDKAYRWLMQLAKNNDKGLEKARTFA